MSHLAWRLVAGRNRATLLPQDRLRSGIQHEPSLGRAQMVTVEDVDDYAYKVDRHDLNIEDFTRWFVA